MNASDTDDRFSFDQTIERRGTDSIKWCMYDEDVLPLWVADMDFPAPPAVVEALRARVDHGCFGYGREPAELKTVVKDRMERLYGWGIREEDLLLLPGVVVGFNLVPMACAQAGEGILIQPPVYHPFFAIASNTGRVIQEAPLVQAASGRYEIDFELFERAITPESRVFLLCNPHNPVGRVLTRGELEKMAEICLRHRLVICSDEIHEDFVYGGYSHIPIASLSPEVAAQTVTLFAPSKSYNIAGFHLSVCHASNPELKARLEAASYGLIPKRPGVLDTVAGLAAYRDSNDWLGEMVRYLQGNRDFLAEYVERHLPGVKMTVPEGTYLAWLDCRDAGIEGPPGEFFLRNARVALNEGTIFGKKEGRGFARLNFGCPRSTLEEALDRMREALASL